MVVLTSTLVKNRPLTILIIIISNITVASTVPDGFKTRYTLMCRFTKMLVTALTTFFKYKAVTDIIVLACWPDFDHKKMKPIYTFFPTFSEQIRFLKEVNFHGLPAIFVSNLEDCSYCDANRIQGVLYFGKSCNNKIKYVHKDYFATRNKWLFVGEELPFWMLDNVRYDSDITLIDDSRNRSYNDISRSGYDIMKESDVTFQSFFKHPKHGVQIEPYGHYSPSFGLRMIHDGKIIGKRQNLEGYPLRIATPIGLYVPGLNNQTFLEYLLDNRRPEVDSAIRCGYGTSSLLVEALNASIILIQTEIWASYTENSSMVRMVYKGQADMSGAVLRMMKDRIDMFDYIMHIWPFRLGFTYIAERASNKGMFVEPFSHEVWWCCLGTGVTMAILLRLTSRTIIEKRGALYSAVAMCLQQDADAVPVRGAGRVVFFALSVCSMLLHAYYTSAIVSALMGTARSGPNNLRELADSHLKIAAEDYEYIRRMFFNVKTNWDDMEYLKKKKMTPNLFQPINKGANMIRNSATAYHAEYNGLYPILEKKLTDNDVCGLKHIDTLPEVMTYIFVTHQSPWTDVMRVKGAWLREIGIAARMTSTWKTKPPPCRETLLAESVKIGDVTSLLAVTLGGVILSIFILFCEILVSERSKRKEMIP